MDAPIAIYQHCDLKQQDILKTALDNAVEMVRKASITDKSKISKKWFGDIDSTQFIKIRETYENVYINFVTMTVTFDCSCRRDRYAQANPANPFLIKICTLFWEEDNKFFDTRAGVLIHEMTHFEVILGTSDYAIGYDESSKLAQINHLKAIHNADNYEYYVEDLVN